MPTKAELKRSSQANAAFHNHYSSIWGEERWHDALLPALLTPTRHAALINTFAQDETISKELDGEQIPSLPCLQRSDGVFPPPRKTPSGLLSHYILDAASVLVATLLDVHPDHSVLDLCAAPGGKSIVIAQSRPASLHSNEPDTSRNKRLAANLKSYLPADFPSKVIRLDGSDKRAIFPLSQYDRILIDAPCSSERHILHKHATNATALEMMNWKASHTKTLARTQIALLSNALRLIKPGGRIVYATCSLSPEENDEVIGRCQAKFDFDIVDAEIDEGGLDLLSEKTNFGRIVLPDHPGGGRWGPLYFCVINPKAG
jgi:16S rRNA C967 or C1407 C5-methylase (RsmB/RsmF family)